MGYMLLNERMLETYLHAKKWMKPEGKMFPSRGDLHVAPFTDEALYMEQINKVNFWYQDYFHGVHLSSLRDAALKEYFRQPIVSAGLTPSICHYTLVSLMIFSGGHVRRSHLPCQDAAPHFRFRENP